MLSRYGQIQAILPAAGLGPRMGEETPSRFLNSMACLSPFLASAASPPARWLRKSSSHPPDGIEKLEARSPGKIQAIS